MKKALYSFRPVTLLSPWALLHCTVLATAKDEIRKTETLIFERLIEESDFPQGLDANDSTANCFPIYMQNDVSATLSRLMQI
jgi:hypothetical protein